jgi:RNA polymerase sigma-70 factor, ECF subfamily
LARARQEGDWPGAAELALRGYGPEIWSCLFRITGDTPTADEVYSQFCEDLWRGLPRFEGRSSFRTWCYRLAHHARARHFDRAHRRHEMRAGSEQFHTVAAQVRSETAWYLRTEAKDRLSQVRESLEPEERELLVLRVENGMAWNEIAEILHGSGSEAEIKRAAGTLRMRYNRVKDKIRRLMSKIDPNEG